MQWSLCESNLWPLGLESSTLPLNHCAPSHTFPPKCKFNWMNLININFNPFLASGYIWCLLISLANRFDPDQARKKCWSCSGSKMFYMDGRWYPWMFIKLQVTKKHMGHFAVKPDCCMQTRKAQTSLHLRKPRILCPYAYEPWHVISNNVVSATSKASDQPAHTRSLIRAFPSRLNIL